MKLRNQSCQLILGHYNITQIRASENFQVLGKNFQALEQKFQALGKKNPNLGTNRDGDG